MGWQNIINMDEMIHVKINVLVCDIDGTLLEADGGTTLQESVVNALLSLQQQGILLILASARIFQGVYPLAKQLQMDVYGGYILSCNGGLVFDVKQNKALFSHEMNRQDCFVIWEMCQNVGLDFAIAQPEYMVASAFTHGFSLDHKNCDMDYVISQHPQLYVQKGITKCSASANKEDIDREWVCLKETVEARFPYKVVRSTPYIIDIVSNRCGKAEALHALFKLLSLSFDEVAAIGDGDSDAEMLRRSAFKATLENGSPLCKQYADIVVKDCKENGCIQFFELLNKDLQGN